MAMSVRYSISCLTAEKETFSILHNMEKAAARMVCVAAHGFSDEEYQHPEMAGLSSHALVAFSFDGEVYCDEMVVELGQSLQVPFAAKGFSVRPLNEGSTINVVIGFFE